MKNLVVLLLIVPYTTFSQMKQITNDKFIDLLNPERKIGLNNWNIVNDDVMGGISSSNLSLSKENNLIYIYHWIIMVDLRHQDTTFTEKP